MGGIIDFLYRYRSLLLFFSLELVCAQLIVSNNQYQGAVFLNSSNEVVSTLLDFVKKTKDYFSLQQVNQEIAKENTRLRLELLAKAKSNPIPCQDSTVKSLGYISDSQSSLTLDSGLHYANAEVINNSVNQFKNYITINQGKRSGIKPGMGVIGQKGVVGKVRFSSQNYAVVISLLNTNGYLSGVIKRTNYFGSIRWPGKDPRYASLEFIPQHAKPQVGDTVITSGFNSIFPRGIPIGIIREVRINQGTQFYDLLVELAEDFNRLSFVAVIKDKVSHEKDSLENQVAEYYRDE